MPDLSVQLGPLKLKNPLITGAGPLAGTADHIRACVDAGFGAVCTKTTSHSPYLQRYPRPLYTLVDYMKFRENPYYIPRDYTWLHREHNSFIPPDKFVHIVKEVADYCHDHDCVLIGTFAGRGLSEWEKTVPAYVEAGVDAMELNFCCPFPPTELVTDPDDAFMGIEYTKHPEKGADIIRRLKEMVDIPLFPKLSPAGGDFIKVAKIFKEAGADGLSFFANEKFLRIDIETGKPVNYGPCAGTMPTIKAHTMRWISEIFMETGLPILGGRGATRWDDIIEFLMAGAAAVEMCSPIMLQGLGYVKKHLQGVEEFMVRKRIDKLESIRGQAVKHIYTAQQMIDDVKALYSEVDMIKCIGCHRCTEVCVYGAIQTLPKKARVIKEKCAGCTLCAQVCPVCAIDVHERDNDEDHFRALAWEHQELFPEMFKDVKKKKKAKSSKKK